MDSPPKWNKGFLFFNAIAAQVFANVLQIMEITKGYSSEYVISVICSMIGVTPTAPSTYEKKYEDGWNLRLRISNHGVYLQQWYNHTRQERMANNQVPGLKDSINLAITFAPNEEECRTIFKSEFPYKIKNVTTAKTEAGNHVKPQFTVLHICYKSWELTDDDINRIGLALIKCTQYHMDYVEPLKNESGKVIMWEDTSNLPPREILPKKEESPNKETTRISNDDVITQWNRDNDKNINESKIRKDMKTNKIRLTESQLRNMIAEAINELDYKTYINAGKKAGKGADISAQRELNPNGTPAQWFQDAVKNRNRAKKFYDKAKEEFNQTHGYKKGGRYDDDYSEVELGGDFAASEEFGPHIRGFKSKGYGEPYKYEYGRRYQGYAGQDMTPEEFFDGNDDALNAFYSANDEWNNYKNGNYAYDNERGWHLKDSELNEMISEAVRKTLNKYRR